MKEMYTAPEAKLVCFEASEKLATVVEDVIDFDDLLQVGGVGGSGEAVEPSKGDINIGV